MSVTVKTRNVVLRRAGGKCERCGRNLDPYWYSLQHRRARGMGGSRLADTNSPVNLVALCGSATSPDGCHHLIENNPEQATREGLRVPQGFDPAAIPVRTTSGWVYLLADGSIARAEIGGEAS